MTLTTWGGVTGLNILIQGVKCIYVIQCLSVSNCFVQKRRLSIFSHCLIMVRSRNWPDLGSSILKFQEKHFIDNVTDISRSQGGQSYLWLALKLFQRWGHLTWPGDLTLNDLDLKFKQNVRNGCMNRFFEKDITPRCCFWDICEKPEGFLFKHPRHCAG